MAKINYLLVFSVVAFLFIVIPSSPLVFATDDEDFDDDEEPMTVKKSVCWSNGDCYKGEYEGKNRTGKGVYTWVNGDRYEGEFYEGKRDGEGTYIWANGDRYVGEYLEDKRDGEGTYTWANGDKFKGEFVAGKRSNGKMVRASKTTPTQSQPTLSATPVLTPSVKEKPQDKLKEEDKVSITQSDQEETKPEINKEEKQSENKADKKIITETESVEDKIGTPIEKEEVNTTPPNSNDKLAGDSEIITTKNKKSDLAEIIEEAFDDLEPEYLAKLDKESTIADTTVEESAEKIEPITTHNEKSAKPTAAIVKNEPLSTQKLTVAKLEDKPAKSMETTPKITEKTPLIEPQNNVPSDDVNLLSEPTLFKWSNGDSYEGKYLNNKRSGKGIYIWSNGDRYTGDFKAGKRHGVGVYIWSNGDRYEGEYVNDERHGKGTYIWANGDRYEGDFFKGQRHGKGKLTWVDGEVYEGAFAEGKRTGMGIYISSGGDRYEGYFEEGKRSGKGILVLANRQPKQLEFENNLYTLDELEFKGGQLVAATATSEIEEDNSSAIALENKSTDETLETESNVFPDNKESQLKDKGALTRDTISHDSNKFPNDHKQEPLSADKETEDNNDELKDEESDNAEFQNNNLDEEY